MYVCLFCCVCVCVILFLHPLGGRLRCSFFTTFKNVSVCGCFVFLFFFWEGGVGMYLYLPGPPAAAWGRAGGPETAGVGRRGGGWGPVWWRVVVMVVRRC